MCTCSVCSCAKRSLITTHTWCQQLRFSGGTTAIKLHLPHTCRIQQTCSISVLHTELLCIELALAKDSVGITTCPWLHAWWPHVHTASWDLCGRRSSNAGWEMQPAHSVVGIHLGSLVWDKLRVCCAFGQHSTVALCANGALSRVRLTPHVLATCTCTSTLCKYDLHMMFHKQIHVYQYIQLIANFQAPAACWDITYCMLLWYTT
jgi:hypothetical protein